MTVYEENKVPIEIDGLEVIQEIHMVAEQLITKGEPCVRYEFGNSMMPFLESGQFCKLTPIKNGDIVNIGDIVVSIVNGVLNTHMVWMKKESNGILYYLIADSMGHPMGWTTNIIAKAEGIPHKINSDEKAIKLPKSISSFISSSEIRPLTIDSSDDIFEAELAVPTHGVRRPMRRNSNG